MKDEQNREAALSHLLTDVFDGDGAGLLRWVRLHLGKTVHDELPAGGPLSQLAFDTTVAIERHGRARQAFASLLEARPEHAGRIQEVAALWGVAMDAIPDSMSEIIPATASARAGRLWEVPELPPHYLARADVEQLERALLEPGGGAVGITAMGQSSQRGVDKYGLYGMGGIGKSVLAAAIARQPAVRERFPGGIFWIAAGQTPRLAFLQTQLCRALGHAEVFDSIGEGTRRLRELVADRAILLVLDDVWDAAHARALEVVGSAGRMLVTTRDLEVLTWLDAREHCLDVLDPAQALSLLADWTQGSSDALPPAAAEVARACGYLPLALAMIGALVRRGRSWVEMKTWLDEAQLVRIQGNVPAYPYRNVLQAVEASVIALATEHGLARQCYIDLAVFPEDTPIPRSALRRLWSRHGLRTADADALADTLSDRALARRDEADRVMLHDLQRLYARSQVDDISALHGALVDAYLVSPRQADARDGRYTGLDDGYFFQHLPWHLAEAGRHDELAALLFDFDWLDAKLHATSVADLLADFAVLPASHPASGEAGLVHDALRLSSHALAHDDRQLPSQLVGRLGGLEQGNARIAALLAQTRGMTRYPWLRPVTPSLTPPGDGLLRTLVGHRDRVVALAVTPDSRRAVSGSRDGTLKLWDLERGTELRTVPSHTTFERVGFIRAVAVTPDGRRAVCAIADCWELWDLEQGTELRTVIGHGDGIAAVAVTPDGRRVISGAWDGTLKLWDLEQGTELCSLAGHAKAIHAVTVIPDGRRAVSASEDQTLKLWDLERGTELRTLTGHTSMVVSVFVTPDGRRAVSQSTDSMKLWDLEQGTELRSYPGTAARMALMPDGQRAVLASISGWVVLVDLEQRRQRRSLGSHGSWTQVVAVTPDGQCAVSGGWDGTLKLWSLDQGTESDHVITGTKAAAMAVTPDGRHALVAWHPHRRQRSTSRDNYALRLWDRERGTELRTLAGHESSVRAMVACDNRYAVSASDDGTLKLWDLEQGTVLRTLTGHQGPVQSVAVTPDGRCAVSGSRDGALKLWDLEQGTVLRTLAGHKGGVNAVAVTSDGLCAVSASNDRTLKLWDLARGTELRSLAGHEHSVYAVAVTPDGRRALSASDDGTLKVWDLEQGTELCTLAGPKYLELRVAVTPDGRRALSSHSGGVLLLWDLEEGKEVRTLTGHKQDVLALTVTPDGQHAISISEDRTLKLWDLDTGQVRATFTADSIFTGCVSSSIAPVFVVADTLGRIHVLEPVHPGDRA